MKNFKLLKMFASLVWDVCPKYVVLTCLTSLCVGGRTVVFVVLPKFLIDELMGAGDPGRLALYTGLIVAASFAFAFANNLIKRHTDVYKVYTEHMMSERLADKIMRVEYKCLEDPHCLDLKERATFAMVNMAAVQELIRNLALFLENAATVVGLLAVMLTLSTVLVAILSACIALWVLLYSRFMKYQMNFFEELIPVNRKYGYYVGLCVTDTVQKDIRLYNISPMLTRYVTEHNKNIFTWLMHYHRKAGLFLGASNTINDLQAALAYGYVGMRVLSPGAAGAIGIGSFTMYVGAAAGFTGAVTSIGMSAINIAQMLGYLDPFMEFMELPDGLDTGTVPFEGEIESIRFENVSFSYPKSDVKVLDGISFEVHGGEKVSIVGLNGAGKTTLVKLIARLYRPDSGTIYINRRDINEYEYASYTASIAAVFQDFRLFAFTVDENITGKKPGSDLIKTGRILAKVGLTEKMCSLEDGIYTMIGKAYDEKATELSGGEQQKIAIARALYKDSPLIILDEPTSALDPLAEAEIYERFNALIGERTALYISHRMSSSVFCDRILVLDGGSISDFDTHAALMEKKDGLYYRLFHSQAENYRIEQYL